MKWTNIALSCALPISMFVVSAHAAVPSPVPSIQKQPVTPGRPLPIKRPTVYVPSLQAVNGSMEIGRETNLHAHLNIKPEGGPSLAGRTIAFSMREANGALVADLGNAVTDASGHATVGAWVTETPGLKLRIGAYKLQVEYKGEAGLVGTRGEGTLVLQKGSTSCVLDRTEDGMASARLTVGPKTSNGITFIVPSSENPSFTVNGAATQWNRSTIGRYLYPLPGSGPWKVKMIYSGGALYNPCASERTITNSSETTYGGPH